MVQLKSAYQNQQYQSETTLNAWPHRANATRQILYCLNLFLTRHFLCLSVLISYKMKEMQKRTCIFLSVSVSKALVASSRRIIAGAFNKVLAMATRCFSPPLSLNPRSPTCNIQVQKMFHDITLVNTPIFQQNFVTQLNESYNITNDCSVLCIS